MNKIITKTMIKKGYEQNLINLIKCPFGDGIVCQIGDNFFYFGGETADEYNDPIAFQKDIPEDTILSDIYLVLCDFKTEFSDEYLYYYYLQENLK